MKKVFSGIAGLVLAVWAFVGSVAVWYIPLAFNRVTVTFSSDILDTEMSAIINMPVIGPWMRIVAMGIMALIYPAMMAGMWCEICRARVAEKRVAAPRFY